MTVNKHTILIGLASLINPVLGLIIGLYKIVSRNTINSFFIAFCISLIYTYMPLLWDTISNYYYVAMFYNPSSSNIYQDIIFYYMNLLDGQYIYIIFLSAFLCSYLALSLISYSNQQNKNLLGGVLLLIGVLYCLDYRYIMDLQKFTLASYISIYASVKIQDKALQFILLLFAWLIHPFTIIFSLIYIIMLYINNKRTYLLLFAILSFVGMLIVPYITESYINNFFPTVYKYLTEFTVDDRYSNPYAIYIIFFCRFLLIVFTIYLMLTVGKANNKTFKLLSSSLIVVLIFANNPIFFERGFLYFSLLAVFNILQSPLTKRLSIISLLILGINLGLNIVWMSNVVFTSSYSVYKNNQIKQSYALKPLYYPSIMLIDLHSNGYSDQKIAEATYVR